MSNSPFDRKPPQKGGPFFPEPSTRSPLAPKSLAAREQAFSKVFRWRLPDGQTEAPATVEVVGSFTQWQKVPMLRDSVLDAWHVTIHHIPGHRTHHYMFLVDGKPAHDKNADGMAIPTGVQEQEFELMTPKGPRVFMLFAQTK